MCGGWYFKFKDYSIFHAGDTGYSNDFKETRSKLGSPKYAFIPIGAYDPEWFMAESHVNPEDAVQIMLDLGAENSFGMHWATFKLTDEDTLEPKERLDRAINNINMNNSILPMEAKVLDLSYCDKIIDVSKKINIRKINLFTFQIYELKLLNNY